MFAEYVKEKYGKDIERCSDKQLYAALLKMVNEMAAKKEKTERKKKLYYISAEFLIGKLLSNNLINLGIYDEVRQELKKAGKKLSDLEEMQPEPSLGNGGLGRLAACFLDSIATLGLPGDGIGLNYHFGLFRQVFKKRMQKELPNPWMEDDSWLIKSDRKYSVSLGKYNVVSTMYDILVTGYDNRTNVLHLFDINSVDEKIVDKGIDFDKKDIQKNLTLFLYPDDSDEDGRLLRVYQQYFMVSNAAQLILDEAEERGSNFHDLADYVELDVHLTSNNVVVVMHDSNLKRTTGVNKNIWQVSYDRIKELDAGSWFSADFAGEQVPTLEEVIKEIGPLVKLNIEIKYNKREKGLTEAVVDIIERNRFEDRCIVTSSDYSVLAEVKKLNSDIKTGYVLSAAYGAYYSISYVDVISINYSFVNKALVDSVHRYGKELYVWTVNAPSIVKSLANMGVDNIITDNPVMAREAVYSRYTGKELINILDYVFSLNGY